MEPFGDRHRTPPDCIDLDPWDFMSLDELLHIIEIAEAE